MREQRTHRGLTSELKIRTTRNLNLRLARIAKATETTASRIARDAIKEKIVKIEQDLAESKAA